MEKTKSKILKYLILAVIPWVLFSCLKEQTQEETKDVAATGSYSGFEFRTTKDINVNVSLLNQQNEPVDGVLVELYTRNPLIGSGQKDPQNNNKIFSAVSDKFGKISYLVSPATANDSLYVLVNYVGLPNLYKTVLNSETIDISIGGDSGTKNAEKVTTNVRASKSEFASPVKVNGYYVLGGWNSVGVPDYLLTPNDIIDNDFLADVNATLPEYSQLPVTHPQYFQGTNSNHVLVENCNMWVTFVHEGAGWTNALGYYTYKTGSTPTSAADLKDLTIIFPNASYSGSGGGMASGNKVQLQYLDPATGMFTDAFPAGVTVGWFLVASGWNGSTKTITAGSYKDYSDDALNIETNSTLKKHSVLLYDAKRLLFLLGFEDARRDAGSDNDFNDAVFYTTVNPITAVDLSEYKPIDKPGDTDGDGVSDVFDDYKTDKLKAFNNYYPSKNGTGTLAFEDLWPYKGDYDFNDLVVDYNINQVTNAKNDVVEIDSKILVRAAGATYRNALAFALNTAPSNIASVKGQKNTKNYLKLLSNGAEAGQSRAVIPVFDDAYNALPYPGSGIGINTVEGNPYSTPDTMFVYINFVTPVTFTTLGTPPYNPFMIVNRVRGVEVHLPNHAPTSLADMSLLGTGQDDSNPGASSYYVSNTSLPWAINFPESFDYPGEKQDITLAHLLFNDWATSKGYSSMDWYQKKPGYRNSSLIYTKK
jgi:LruC domain-containing protein